VLILTTKKINSISSKIFFFYPSKAIGGVEMLFYRLASQCNSNSVEFGVIDYNDGFVCSRLQDDGVSFYFVNCEEVSYDLVSSEDILICPLSMLCSPLLKRVLNRNCRVLFWDVHPFNLIEQTAFSFIYKKKNKLLSGFLGFIELVNFLRIKNVITCVNSAKSLYFMCRSNFEYSQSFFHFDFTPSYLPILIDTGKNNLLSVHETSLSPTLRFAWLGRLDKDKIPCLNALLEDLDIALAQDVALSCTFLVIGDGDSKQNLHKPINFEIVYIGSKNGSELDSIITTQVDIGFAVGTACLEFAVRGIPTVMLPNPSHISCFESVRKKYALLSDSVNFEVCVEPYFNKDNLIEAKDFFYIDRASATVACFNYCLANHYIDIVYSRFIKATSDSFMTLCTLDKFNAMSIYSRFLYSMKSFIKRLVDY